MDKCWWIINQTHYDKAVFKPLYFEFLSQPVRAVHEERCARTDGHKTTCSFLSKERKHFLQQQNNIITNIYVIKVNLFFHVWCFIHQ